MVLVVLFASLSTNVKTVHIYQMSCDLAVVVDGGWCPWDVPWICPKRSSSIAPCIWSGKLPNFFGIWCLCPLGPLVKFKLYCCLLGQLVYQSQVSEPQWKCYCYWSHFCYCVIWFWFPRPGWCCPYCWTWCVVCLRAHEGKLYLNNACLNMFIFMLGGQFIFADYLCLLC